eukprot:472848-Prymnesium_polylepis.1
MDSGLDAWKAKYGDSQGRSLGQAGAVGMQPTVLARVVPTCAAEGHDLDGCCLSANARLDECAATVVAGVTLMLAPGVGFSFAVAGMTSVRGRSHTFDARADGCARGEACGGVALVVDGVVAALEVLGSAVRQDGRSASLTAPNGQAQQGLLAAAWGDAGVGAGELSLSEAHGTGTALGDPIEAGSLVAEVASCGDALIVRLATGGVKANVGHAEPAAGMMGLLKLVVGLDGGQVAPNA